MNYFQINKETFLLRFFSEKGKKEYVANINEKDITDNRKYWQTIEPFLSNKVR